MQILAIQTAYIRVSFSFSSSLHLAHVKLMLTSLRIIYRYSCWDLPAIFINIIVIRVKRYWSDNTLSTDRPTDSCKTFQGGRGGIKISSVYVRQHLVFHSPILQNHMIHLILVQQLYQKGQIGKIFNDSIHSFLCLFTEVVFLEKDVWSHMTCDYICRWTLLVFIHIFVY